LNPGSGSAGHRRPATAPWCALSQGQAWLANPAGPDTLLDSGQMAVLDGAGEVPITAGDGGAGMLLLSGRPLGEPIVQYGPFVMNTAAEIRQAIRDYQSGALVAPSA
jgi:redox-sensitive bicupin YhaK (pirin superfamily)